jgi:Family of unknown function (DUF6600)
MFSRTTQIFILLVMSFAIAPVVHAQSVDVNIGIFYNSLAPYGEWVQHPSYGWVWTPANMQPGWRPYTDGRWVYTDDYGWMYTANNEWGWATYHYGRWAFDPYFGWFWVPGTVWAPAWVAWRHGNGYVGWAPLPPQVGWSMNSGLQLGGIDLNVNIGWDSWVFTENRWFDDPYLNNHIAVPGRNVTIINITNNVTNYTVINNRIVNRSVRLEDIERETNRKVPRYKIMDQDMRSNDRRYVMKGNTIQVYHPVMRDTKPEYAPKNVLPPPKPEQINNYKKQIDVHYQQQQEQLKKIHEVELKKVQQDNASKQKLEAQHQQEMLKLNEQQQREKLVIENKQKFYQEQKQNKNKDQSQTSGQAQTKDQNKKKEKPKK